MVDQDVQMIVQAKKFGVSVQSQDKNIPILNDIDFTIIPGQVVGIVGESGSGKSIFAMSLGGLLQDNAAFNLDGDLNYMDIDGQINLSSTSQRILQNYRKNKVTNIFQDPYASLNPSITCGRQIKKVLTFHGHRSGKEEVKELLTQTGFEDTDRIYDSYPHQLSGGECQRIVICITLASRSSLIIADEPTSSLDAEIESGIIKRLLDLRSSLAATIVLISHDMNLIRQYCDIIYVMNNGRFIASGRYEELKKTLDSRVVHNLFVDFPKRVISDSSASELLLELKEVTISYQERSEWIGRIKENEVLKNISFNLYSGEILGLVGRSGSGKSSLAKAIVRLLNIKNGQIIYRGKELNQIPINSFHSFRNEIQLILQDSYLSFNPAYSVRTALIQTAENRYQSKADFSDLIVQLFARMQLDQTLLDLFPQELSGGQRQRVLLVRAMIMKPKILICDESVMALDPHIKKSILDLLRDLVETDQISILLISHDIASVEYVCDRIINLDQYHVPKERS